MKRDNEENIVDRKKGTTYNAILTVVHEELGFWGGSRMALPGSRTATQFRLM